MLKIILALCFFTPSYAGTVRITDHGVAEFTQTTTPANPIATKNRLYFKSDDKVYRLNSAGTELEVGAGGGDVSSNTASSVDSEIALFSSTTGKLIKRATGTGYAKITSGVLSAQSTPLPAADLPAPATSAIAASDIDWSVLLKTGGVYTKTLAANTTFTFSNAAAGVINVRVTNTASNFTAAWPTVRWTGGAAPVATIGAKSTMFTFISDGTDIYGNAVLDMY